MGRMLHTIYSCVNNFLHEKNGLVTASVTLCPLIYPTARRGGLRGAGGISTDSKIAANIEWAKEKVCVWWSISRCHFLLLSKVFHAVSFNVLYQFDVVLKLPIFC